MCHILLQTPKFFQLLLQIDIGLAEQIRAGNCQWCGGILHKADYPRKPRGCPTEVRADYESRFSFCCSQCRKRTTAVSVRFLGRRVYLSLAVVLLPTRQSGMTEAATQLCKTLNVPARTLSRWRGWWTQLFPITPLWQAECARFMPPVETSELPGSLIARFTDPMAESMAKLLAFLTPLTIRQ